MGVDLYGAFEEALRQPPPVSIRLNPLKCAGATVTEELHDGTVAWCRDGVYLKRRPNFTFDPLLHAGVYYVQEASSMFIQHVVSEELKMKDGGLMVLDLCAAPGGKSTAVRAALPPGSLLISNEPVRQRANILSENIQKSGHPDVIVTNNYAKDFAAAGIAFDIIICDVPCSGEGMFRKDGGAISEWSAQNVEKCRIRQRGIVSDIMECLRPGGLLIYSTCTFNEKENEENIEWAATELGAEIIEVHTEKEWSITGALSGNCPVYRFIPGKTRGEGLFMAVMRGKAERGKVRKEPEERKGKREWRHPEYTVNAYTGKPVGKWLTDAGNFKIIRDEDRLRAIPLRWEHIYGKVKRSLKVIHAGVTLGRQKGSDIIPDQSLALSTALNREAFPTEEINHTQAISYLRKEAITLSGKTPQGIVLLTYRDIPVGFVKNIGSRTNNLYPQEWKIKSTHIPQEEKILEIQKPGCTAANDCNGSPQQAQL